MSPYRINTHCNRRLNSLLLHARCIFILAGAVTNFAYMYSLVHVGRTLIYRICETLSYFVALKNKVHSFCVKKMHAVLLSGLLVISEITK
jgi:hypothetical protein